jgi:hypothetical protein
LFLRLAIIQRDNLRRAIEYGTIYFCGKKRIKGKDVQKPAFEKHEHGPGYFRVPWHD